MVKKILVISGGLLLIATSMAAGPPDPTPSIVGQVISATAEVDGVAVPSGTTIFGGSILQAGSSPAVFHLIDGRSIELLSGSAALVQDSRQGEVLLSVLGGKAVVAPRNAKPANVRGESNTSMENLVTAPPDSAGKIVAILAAPATGGSLRLDANTTEKIDRRMPILIRDHGLTSGEIHEVASIEGLTVVLATGLKNDFSRGALLIQGESNDGAVVPLNSAGLGNAWQQNKEFLYLGGGIGLSTLLGIKSVANSNENTAVASCTSDCPE